MMQKTLDWYLGGLYAKSDQRAFVDRASQNCLLWLLWPYIDQELPNHKTDERIVIAVNNDREKHLVGLTMISKARSHHCHQTLRQL